MFTRTFSIFVYGSSSLSHSRMYGSLAASALIELRKNPVTQSAYRDKIYLFNIEHH